MVLIKKEDLIKIKKAIDVLKDLEEYVYRTEEDRKHVQNLIEYFEDAYHKLTDLKNY
jgi:hypothetical protein